MFLNKNPRPFFWGKLCFPQKNLRNKMRRSVFSFGTFASWKASFFGVSARCWWFALVLTTGRSVPTNNWLIVSYTKVAPQNLVLDDWSQSLHLHMLALILLYPLLKQNSTISRCVVLYQNWKHLFVHPAPLPLNEAMSSLSLNPLTRIKPCTFQRNTTCWLLLPNKQNYICIYKYM